MTDREVPVAPAVWMSQACSACGGTGNRSVERSAGQSKWTKRVDCDRCDGSGRTARWVEAAELRTILEASEG